MEAKPITYQGIQFRSKLECRHYNFMKKIGWNIEYDAESKDVYTISASHTGYEKQFGDIHKRLINEYAKLTYCLLQRIDRIKFFGQFT